MTPSKNGKRTRSFYPANSTFGGRSMPQTWRNILGRLSLGKTPTASPAPAPNEGHLSSKEVPGIMGSQS